MDIKFNDEEQVKQTPYQKSKGITGWLINNGVVKNESQAFVIFIAVCAVCWIGTFILLFAGGASSTEVIDPNAPDPAALDPQTGLPYPTQ